MPSVMDTLNQSWANDTNKFGYQMLLKMGWNEGKGLGKNEDGIETHVKVAKRQENLGIGCVDDGAGNMAFTSQISNFNDILAELNATHGKQKSSESSEKSKKKKSKKEKKRKRETQEVKDAAVEDEEPVTKTSKSVKEDASDVEANDDNKKGKDVAWKKHRYSKIARAKNVKSYSAVDLKAILGGVSS